MSDFDPDWVSAPGDTLIGMLELSNLSILELADAGNLEPMLLLGVVFGDEPITDNMASVLAREVGSSPEFWMNREKHYREGLRAGKDHLAKCTECNQSFDKWWMARRRMVVWPRSMDVCQSCDRLPLVELPG